MVRKLDGLPAAPKVLHSLKRVLAADDSSIDSIAEIVKLEPGLSARVVRIANSVQFGRGAQIENIVEAIQRVGLRGVHELVTFAVASQMIGRPLTSYGLNAQELWSRAVACAIAASSLAEHCEMELSDAYTAGLMHGLGLMVINCYTAKERKSHSFVTSGYPQDYAPAEQDLLGFNHAEAGAALLELWGFSERVVGAVRFQLNPEDARPEHRQLAMILATARWARSRLCVPDPMIPDVPSPVGLQEAGVQIEDFGWWLSQVRIRYQIACDELRLA